MNAQPKRRRWPALVLTVAAVVSALGWSAAPANAATGTANQYATFPAGRLYGTFHFQFAHSELCLNVPGSAPWRGRWLTQSTCDTSSPTGRQYWQMWVTSSGVDFMLRNPWTGLCANIDHAVYGYGTHIILWDCYDPSGAPFPNEFFKAGYDSLSVPPADYFWFVASQSTGWALNVDHALQESGAHVILWNLQKQALNEQIRWF